MRGRLVIVMLGLVALGLLPASVSATPGLTKLSTDLYTNPTSQHRTQVEPDSYAFGTTVVAAFQSGRFFDGGASNIGWATSRDGGATWTHGFLPHTTVFAGGSYARVSDPAVAYDAKHAVWLINTLGISSPGQSSLVSRSTDGGLTWGDPILLSGPNGGYDKDWLACDNTATSPYYGSCYSAWDNADLFGTLLVSVSRDGGATWSNPLILKGTNGLGVQPLALPDGTVVMPYEGFDGNMRVVRSTNGGASWSASQLISPIADHQVAGGLRSEPLPSAEMDAGGRVYLAWQDCRFIRQCRANDIVLTTTTDGVTWTPVRRIPLDAKKSGVDHFIPGIAADPQTSGGAAHLALTYYYYDHAACTAPTCTLNVGFATSRDGGATWSTQTKLAGPMELAWLPDTSLGAMVGDYISTSFVGGKAVPVLAMARSFTTRFREAIYAPTNGLPVPVGVNPVSVEPVEATQSDHAARPVRRVP